MRNRQKIVDPNVDAIAIALYRLTFIYDINEFICRIRMFIPCTTISISIRGRIHWICNRFHDEHIIFP